MKFHPEYHVKDHRNPNYPDSFISASAHRETIEKEAIAEIVNIMNSAKEMGTEKIAAADLAQEDADKTNELIDKIRNIGEITSDFLTDEDAAALKIIIPGNKSRSNIIRLKLYQLLGDPSDLYTWGYYNIRKEDPIANEILKLDPSAISFAPDSWQRDRQTVLKAIQYYGTALKFTPSFSNDAGIVLAAVKNDPKAFKFAGDKIKKLVQEQMS